MAPKDDGSESRTTPTSKLFMEGSVSTPVGQEQQRLRPTIEAINSMSRLSATSRRYDITNKGYLDDTEKALRALDTDNKGELDLERVYQIMKDLQEQQHKSMNLRRIITGLLMFTSVLAISNLATAFAAVTLAKETTTGSDAIMRVKTTGEPVSTRGIDAVLIVDSDENTGRRRNQEQQQQQQQQRSLFQHSRMSRALYTRTVNCDDSNVWFASTSKVQEAFGSVQMGSSLTLVDNSAPFYQSALHMDNVVWTEHARDDANSQDVYRVSGYIGRMAETAFEITCYDSMDVCIGKNCMIGVFGICAPQDAIQQAATECADQQKPYCDDDNSSDYDLGLCLKRCDNDSAENGVNSCRAGHVCLRGPELDYCPGQASVPQTYGYYSPIGGGALGGLPLGGGGIPLGGGGRRE